MYTFFYSLNLFLVFTVVLYSLFIIVHIVSWLSLGKTEGSKNPSQTKVSVVIPARNEERNISSCLQSILAQNYPSHLLEIVVCDDGSEDNTKKEALNTLNKGIIKSYYIHIPTEVSGKKQAIEAGIKASSGELIVLTDADCIAEKTWVSSIVTAYEQTSASMLCGPVSITHEKNLCSRFQALEMCGLSLLSGGGIKAGIPLLSNAANIAYTRKAFEAVHRFSGIDSTPSGDDILLMFKIHQQFPGSIHYVKNMGAMVYTQAQPSWKELYQQRIRWASKGLHAKNSLNSIVSLLVLLANFLPLISILGLFIYPTLIKIVVSSLILKLLIDFLLLSFAAKFFRKESLLLYYPVAAIIVMIYTSIVGVLSNSVPFRWKGRNYHQ
jgi:cellulose synthase/poly-beta-1,6-N-acetylglucosamine synthase-like glycosyltransferase